MTTFIVAPTLFSGQSATDKIALAMYFPAAESSSLQEGVSTPITTSPSGGQGHTVEVPVNFADGSTKVISNERYALASIGGMFGMGGLIGVVVSILHMLVSFILIRKKKEK